MSDTLIVGIVSTVATVILGPIVVRLLSWLGEKRSQLLVVLTWHSKAKNELLNERVSKLITTSEAFKQIDLGDEHKFDEIKLFHAYFSAQSYLRFVILNNSRKKLTNLTLSDNAWSDLYQIDDGELRKVDRSQPMILGDLQPGRQIVLHVLDSGTLPEWGPKSKERFKFSADELDRVKIREPMPLYLKRRYIQWTLNYVTLCSFLIGIVSLGYSILKR